jgi:hypothetical protein
VRIDPTFGDANWVNMACLGNPDHLNGLVKAADVDGSGNLYIGGYFTSVGETVTNRIAKWNGGSWTTLGLGMNGGVEVLAVSGSDVYAGGVFTRTTNSGGMAVTVNGIAKWNGSTWSALGSGMNGPVYGLRMLGTDLYAGGDFTTAGGSGATNIAKWNGSSWSALGSRGARMSGAVIALVVSGGDLYAAD